MAFPAGRLRRQEERVAIGRHRGWSRYSSRTFYLFIMPWLLIGFVGTTAIPLAYALGLSFTNFDGLSGHWRWIGLRNYAQLIVDGDTWFSLWRTVLLAAITVPLGTALGLGLALLLNRHMRGISVYRTIFYVPSIVPIVATALMWKLIFDRDTGVLNAAIERVGGSVVTWLADPTAFYVLIVMVLWGVGGGMIIFLAGLQGIPPELREAAAIDGAGPVQTFRSVTLPLLTPVIFFQMITGVIGSLQRLIEPFLLASTGGATDPTNIPRSNFLYMINVYTQVFYNQRFGYGSALLWLLFILVLALTLVVFRTSTFWVHYEVDQQGGEG